MDHAHKEFGHYFSPNPSQCVLSGGLFARMHFPPSSRAFPPNRNNSFRRHPRTASLPGHLGVMWRSQYGAPVTERSVRGLEEISPGSMMGNSARSTPSPSTASLHSSYSSASPSPTFKTQTNGAGWGHCAPPRFNQAPVLV
jgi:hypothetical protein